MMILKTTIGTCIVSCIIIVMSTVCIDEKFFETFKPEHLFVRDLLKTSLGPLNYKNNKNTTPYEVQLYEWVYKVLSILGANAILDGTPSTNQGLLQGPLNSISPTEEEARYYISLAGAAYCQRNLDTWGCPWCLPGYTFKGLITNDTYQTLAYFAVNDERKEIIVAFRGSQNMMNFLLDFIPVPVDSELKNFGEPIMLHLGFKLMTNSLYPQVIDKLTTIVNEIPEDYKIIFTGHSLGANQASISVFQIFHSQIEIFTRRTIELYTYGGNRLGNRAFADFMNQLPIKIARIVARGDMAPRITSPAALGYYHFQNEIWIYDLVNNGTDTRCSRAVYEDPKCSDSLGPFYTSLDHLVYYHVDIALCYPIQDPNGFLLQFIIPVKQFVPQVYLILFQCYRIMLQ